MSQGSFCAPISDIGITESRMESTIEGLGFGIEALYPIMENRTDKKWEMT